MENKLEGFRDSSNLKKWVVYLIYVQIIVAVISIYSNFIEYNVLIDLKNGIYVEQEVNNSDQRQWIISIINLCVFIVSGFLILRWIYRANFNAVQLGAVNMTFTPGWSIGYYFIPVLAFWKPYQAMKEIWEKSSISNDSEYEGNLLGIWWFLWIGGTILDNGLGRLSFRAEEIHEFLDLNMFGQLSNLINIILGLVLIAVVNKIHMMQIKKYQYIKSFNAEISKNEEKLGV